MFGLSYAKFDSVTYVIQYKNGKVVREGRGLAFFYGTLGSSIAAVPLASNDLPFIFNETTADYQSITIQGQLSYRVREPRQLAELLDFTVNSFGIYKKNDLEKLNQRLVNEAQAATSAYVHSLGLKDSIRSNKQIEAQIKEGLQSSPAVTQLGIEVLGINILAVKATPEMERALEAETRERLQQEADQAVYERRNFAVEQERRIKESELNTDIAVEEKRKQIDEKRSEAQLQRAANERKLRELQVQADIAVEASRAGLLTQQTANQRLAADAQGYVTEATLRPFRDLDWRTLTALQNNPDPRLNISLAFREMAENAAKIGTLNITPNLLDNVLGSNGPDAPRRPAPPAPEPAPNPNKGRR
ncbi:SPFH domain-containing protein [Hymenobacter sp. H14-R3]|uniref:SPFH domain-containing protein n=1 Tax=Hymenobacter sp. H14-R3 TaxID=3046308 RepID=UPI0024B92FF7|nr:SPFH domain-containing protein [Hymenobacter sp. H14-R3]MDJ0366832.1 SPFH domain-containing protein [Hymenobacter sp. H14-R3]